MLPDLYRGPAIQERRGPLEGQHSENLVIEMLFHCSHAEVLACSILSIPLSAKEMMFSRATMTRSFLNALEASCSIAISAPFFISRKTFSIFMSFRISLSGAIDSILQSCCTHHHLSFFYYYNSLLSKSHGSMEWSTNSNGHYRCRIVGRNRVI